MSEFFKYFPSVSYSKFGRVKDITARVGISNKDNAKLLRYNQTAARRADVLADLYYDDPAKDWLVYYSNDVIDPINDLYQNETSLNDIISTRFGSIETASCTKRHWINNWREDDSQLTTVVYESLPPSTKQLYNPVLDYRGTATGFVRKKIDTIKHTSIYATFELPNNVLVVGDLVEFVNGSTQLGTGEIYNVIGNFVTVYHIEDQYATSFLRKRGTTVNYSILGTSNIIQCISLLEAAYYSSESEYEYAVRINGDRRKIHLIDKRFSDSVVSQLKEHLLS